MDCSVPTLYQTPSDGLEPLLTPGATESVIAKKWDTAMKEELDAIDYREV